MIRIKFHSYHWCPSVKLVASFLNKLQKQPERTRKIIFWVVIIAVGLGLGFWWVSSSYRRLKEFKKEEFINNLNLSPLEEGLKDLEKMKDLPR